MKKRLKGLLALTLSLVMVFALATNAWAITVDVNYQSLSADGASATDYNGGTATLDIVTVGGVETYILTLDNFVSLYGSPLSADDSLTLKLIGTNAIAAASGGSHAISISGDLTIEGDGELNAVGNMDNSGSYGISANTVTINGGKVLATGTDIGISGNNITINGGEVSAEGGKHGIATQTMDSTVTIKGGTVDATGGEYGIYGYSGVSISDSEVTAKGDEEGIRADAGDISISDSMVTAEGNNYGIISGESVSINGGEVTAEGNSYGIYGGSTVTIEGGTVTAKATATTDSVGINAGNTITIGGDGNPTVDVGCSVGLQADNVNILESCTLTINTKSADAGVQPMAIYCTTLTLSEAGAQQPYWYQWKADDADVNVSSNTNQLDEDAASAAQKLIIEKATTGGGGGTPGGPPTPQPPIINWGGWVDTTPEEEPEKVEAPKTFDGGVALSVAMTLLAATGGAWLSKKKD